MLEIDGGTGEGGGQIVRTSLSLSALTCTPFRIHNIRMKRPKPGLRPQHLAAVQTVAVVTGASVEGARIGSPEFLFRPSTTKPGEYSFDIGTAGAVSLVLQTLIPPLLFAGGRSHLAITGGTHVPISPPFDLIEQVFFPILALMGVRLACSVGPYGFYPKGGGRIVAHIEPCAGRALAPLSLAGEKGASAVRGTSAVANLPLSIAERQRASAASMLENAKIDAEIAVISVPSPGPGTFLFLKTEGACPAGFSAIGVRGKRAEVVGAEGAGGLLAHLSRPGCLDPYTSDQVVLYLALAQGRSEYTTTRITRHLVTNIGIVKRFIGADIVVEGEIDAPGRVSVEGIGYRKD